MQETKYQVIETISLPGLRPEPGKCSMSLITGRCSEWYRIWILQDFIITPLIRSPEVSNPKCYLQPEKYKTMDVTSFAATENTYGRYDTRPPFQGAILNGKVSSFLIKFVRCGSHRSLAENWVQAAVSIHVLSLYPSTRLPFRMDPWLEAVREHAIGRDYSTTTDPNHPLYPGDLNQQRPPSKQGSSSPKRGVSATNQFRTNSTQDVLPDPVSLDSATFNRLMRNMIPLSTVKRLSSTFGLPKTNSKIESHNISRAYNASHSRPRLQHWMFQWSRLV